MSEAEGLPQVTLCAAEQRKSGANVPDELYLSRHETECSCYATPSQDHRSRVANIRYLLGDIRYFSGYGGRMTGRTHGNGDHRTELIASEIRAWLGRRNKSQSDLARHLGIARSAVSVRMSGSRDFTVVELMEIAEWLDITLADLLGPSILQARRSPHTELVGAGASGASAQLPRLDSNQQPFD